MRSPHRLRLPISCADFLYFSQTNFVACNIERKRGDRIARQVRVLALGSLRVAEYKCSRPAMPAVIASASVCKPIKVRSKAATAHRRHSCHSPAENDVVGPRHKC